MLRRINDEIDADHLVSVRFPFKPARIPVSLDLRFDESQSRWLFASLVWLNEESVWAIFEFDNEVMSVLSAYAMRNNGMQKLEILISRHKDGSIKLNAGFDSLEPVDTLVDTDQFGVMKGLADRLVERYRKKPEIVMKV